MSKLFEKAVKIAQERQAWEAKVNPEGEPWVFRKFTEAELSASQKHITDFQAEMLNICKAAKFESIEQAKMVLDALDYEKQYMPLWAFAEMCMPIQDETMVLAQALAPARLGTVQRIREGKFGIYDLEHEKEAVLIHKASDKNQNFGSGTVRGDVARAAQEARLAEQSKAFDQLSGAIGAVMKTAPKGKSLSQAKASLETLGGVKMVEGEKIKVDPKLQKGQIGLFSEEQAPTPPKVPKPKKAGK